MAKMFITPKQKKFADEFLATGNQVQSALKAYNTDSYKTASVIGNENLAKPRVLRYLESKSEGAAIRVVELSEQDENLTVALGASKDILDRAGYKPVEKSVSLTVNVDTTMTEKEKALALEYEDRLRDEILNPKK